MDKMDSNHDEAVIAQARIDDLDLDDEADAATWEARLVSLADQRVQQARSRLEGMGIIDHEGNLKQREIPADMLPESETSVVTG